MDVSFASLWLPIVVSAVAVFILSFVMWMVLPHHNSDYKGLPDEDAVMGALRDQGVQPGQYLFPHCADKSEWSNPEFKKKYMEGPTGQLVLRGKGSMNMGKNMLVSTGYNLAISVLTAYVASFALNAETAAVQVFRLTSIVAFLGYAGALGWGVIWWGRSWSSTIKEMLDGLIYGIATGLVFMLFW